MHRNQSNECTEFPLKGMLSLRNEHVAFQLLTVDNPRHTLFQEHQTSA